MTSLTKNVNNKDDPYVYTGGNYFRYIQIILYFN
jgi:hypothetical protein